MVYEEWPEYDQYRITNYPGEGYVVEKSISINPGMKPDLSDLRISDGTDSPLSFFIDSISGTTAIIKIRTGRSPDVYFHYGNPSAVSESNPYTTYDFYEDFNSIDTNVWTVVSGSPTVTDSVLAVPAGTTFRSVASFLWSNIVIESKVKPDINYRLNFGSSYTRSFLYDVSSTWLILNDSTGTSIQSSSSTGPTANAFGIAKTVYSTTSVTGYWNNVQKVTTTNTDQTSQPISFRHWYQGTAYWDWIRIRKYASTEPTLTYVSSHAKLLFPLLSSLEFAHGHYYNIRADSEIPEIEIAYNLKFNLNLVSDLFISQTGKIEAETEKALIKYRISDVFCEEPFSEGKFLNIQTNSFASFLVPVNKLEATTQSANARPSDISISKPEFSVRTASWGMRTTDVFAGTVSAKATKTGMFYRPADSYLPEIENRVKTESIFSRESSSEVPIINSDITWKGVFNRTADFSIGNIELKVEAFRGILAQADFEVTTPEIIADRLLNLPRNADNTMNTLGIDTKVILISNLKAYSVVDSLFMSCGLVSDINRESDFENQPLYLIGSHSSVFSRESSSTVETPETDASIVRGFSRDSDAFINSLSLTGLAELNDRTIYYPYIVSSTISDYNTEAVINSFTVSLNKDCYYVSVGDGETMLELTQYDTETIFGTLQDTDPETGELRLMPLSGKTVKLVLKGGNPETTVVADSTVTGAGSVRTDLTSTDLAIPGKYYLKYVVLGTNYRKEIPDSRDEYIEVIVNEASYPAT